jgi:cytoskeleton protein RodZ
MVPTSVDLPATGETASTSIADPMPTASTGTEEAEVAVTEEPMPDDQPVMSADSQASEDTAGSELNGLDALIAKEVAPVSGDKTTAAPAMEQKVASAEDVTLTNDGRAFGGKNEGSRLTLKAKAQVWVRIEDSQGNVVMTQMLMRGDTYKVPSRDGLVVIARDGGLLSYIIDGKEKGILGTPGEILVGRSLDLKTLDGKG